MLTTERTFVPSDGAAAQSRPVACRPDGSVKWTTHAIAPATPAKSCTPVAGEIAAE
ncbi:hypothetical protein AB0G15_16915 [Streptosporangium sp. NPDC023825]|uniref:RIFT barrel domain-containing protein n=1 Tax=Streptosporangium sp. NPDC023825 TaxID=3154909 RepID=UPI0034311AA6